MAFVCSGCSHVHPKGAVTCEQAREMIKQSSRELDHDIRHHQETCLGCPNPYQTSTCVTFAGCVIDGKERT